MTAVEAHFMQSTFTIEMDSLACIFQSPQWRKRIYRCPAELRKKDRYADIFTYDHTRVRLRADDSTDKCSDYINADWIEPILPGNTRRYIATQAPPPAALEDFWKMIWDEQVCIVFMLSRCYERSVIKAHRYWPEEDVPVSTIGAYLIHLEDCITKGDVVLRRLRISKSKCRNGSGGGDEKPLPEDETRLVTHVQFTGWPDHGVPDEYQDIVSLFEIVEEEMKASDASRPVLVHCSAGIGRTGTYIAIESIVNYIRNEFKEGTTSLDKMKDLHISVFEVVRRLRAQRPGMVQTKSQYAFIHLFFDYCLTYPGRLGLPTLVQPSSTSK